MRKYLLLSLLALFCCGMTAQAQRIVPKYKKKKEVREYDLGMSERRWTVTFGGSYNMALGAFDRIRYIDRGEVVRYDRAPSFSGGSVHLGTGYKFTDHFTLGAEAGMLFQYNDYALPLYATATYYYGQSKGNLRHRWFNYVNLGPQFYFSGRTKTGAMAAAGGGVRVILAGSLKMDLQLGYQLNMHRPDICDTGKYDIPAANVRYKEYTHLLQVGINFIIF
ncbi:MAG: hypothetical protein MR292_04640 [Alistipes sp.]|nr:hypothetical protein [Alistipes sp.]